MRALFHEVNSLDQSCYENFHLTPDLLMEHAANSVALYIHKHFSQTDTILILTGSGHNGADGLALARLLCQDYSVKVFEYKQQKSDLGQLQKKRAQAVGVVFTESLEVSDLYVDALFGTGLNRFLEADTLRLIAQINQRKGKKIAVDIPSGILSDGKCSRDVFSADVTVTMGALKSALYSDVAKDFTGKIEVANLGVSHKLYEAESTMYVLEATDIKLPSRNLSNTHKGSFGHACFISGEKQGASVMAGLAALAFGSGLVTLVGEKEKTIPFELMHSQNIADNCTALCVGMGLGLYSDALHQRLKAFEGKLLIDADLFYDKRVEELLHRDSILTPHPKEFCALLKLLELEDIDVETLQNNRLAYVKLFVSHYPQTTLLLKGSHVIIANKNNIYINPLGTAVLSKGGSGDVLCGLITALLAQGYESIDAALSGSLAHTQAGNTVQKSSYAVTPRDLIERVGHLE